MNNEIDDFNENEIRKAILNKAPLKKINKKSKHWKGYIYLDDKLVGKVKIPNDHKRVMKSSKSTYIANDLSLNGTEFNRFVECTLSSSEYKKIISSKIKNST